MRGRPGLLPILLCTFLALCAGAWLWLENDPPVPAPRATFTTITGEKVSLDRLRGRPVIVTFWATDCRSCIEEIPMLKAIHRDFSKRGLEIIAVNMFYDPPNRVVAFSKMHALPYKVALDLRAEHARSFDNVRLTPTTFLIDPQGSIVLRKTGLLNEQELRDRIHHSLQ